MSTGGELSVVCKGCGSEASPYVTECPYCGHRLRKRAPKLERTEAGIEVLEKHRARRGRGGSFLARRARGGSALAAADRPVVTAAAILAPAALLLVNRASALTVADLGALLPGSEQWWRYLAAPFVYENLGYLFVVAAVLVIFGTSLERQLGHLPLAVLALGCGALGMVATAAIEPLPVAAGGSGIALGLLAAWFALRELERRRGGEDFDWIAAAVCAAVLLALPIFEASANVWAALGGAAVGALAGLLTGALGPRAQAG